MQSQADFSRLQFEFTFKLLLRSTGVVSSPVLCRWNGKKGEAKQIKRRGKKMLTMNAFNAISDKSRRFLIQITFAKDHFLGSRGVWDHAFTLTSPNPRVLIDYKMVWHWKLFSGEMLRIRPDRWSAKENRSEERSHNHTATFWKPLKSKKNRHVCKLMLKKIF